MSKPIIAVDVDDVLADSAGAVVAFSNKTWGTHLKPEDFDEDWSKMWGVDLAELERRAAILHDPELFESFLPDPEAYLVLQRLSADFDLVVATSRRQVLAAATERWLDRHYAGLFKGVYYSGIYEGGVTAHSFIKTKAEMVLALKASYLIDDQVKHCIGATEHGLQALLFGDRSWNQHDALPAGVARCKDWAAVEAYFDGHR